MATDILITPASGTIDFNNGTQYSINGTIATMEVDDSLTAGNLSIHHDGSGVMFLDRSVPGNVFEVFGSYGTLFAINDDLSNSLFSVNNAAGQSVFEVFANNTIVGGAYGANSFYLDTNGNLGLGTASPTRTLHIKGDNKVFLLSSNDYEVATIGPRGSSGTNLDAGVLGLKANGTFTVVVDAAGSTYFNGGSVGIGTTPASGNKLHIHNGVGNGSGVCLYVDGSGDIRSNSGGSLFFGAYDYAGSTYIRGYDTSNGLYFYIDGTLRAQINNGTYALDVTGSARVTTDLFVNDQLAVKTTTLPTSNNFHVSSGTTGSASKSSIAVVSVADNSTFTNGVAALHVINSGNRGTKANGSGSDLLRLEFSDSIHTLFDKNGDVGIGTITPSAKLHVVGSSLVTGNTYIGDTNRYFRSNSNGVLFQTTHGYIFLGPDNVSWAHIQTDRANFYFNAGLTVDGGRVQSYNENLILNAASSGSYAIDFRSGNTTYMYMTAGSLGIGTNTPSYKLDVITPDNSAISVRATSASHGILIGAAAYSTSNAYMGMKTSYMTGISDYMIISGISDANTYVSAGANYAVHIRGGGNDTNNQIIVRDSTYNTYDAATYHHFSGSVGIGAAPSYPLDVDGNAVCRASIGIGGAIATTRVVTITNVAATDRPAIKIINPNFSSNTSSTGKTFYRWLPIDIDGTTRWIAIYS